MGTIVGLDDGPSFLDLKALAAMAYKPVKDLDTWSPGTFYNMGDRIRASNGRAMIAECAGQSGYGTSGQDDPHFPEMEGCTVLDGTVVWKSEGFPLGVPPQWAREIIEKAAVKYNIFASPDDKPIIAYDMNGNVIGLPVQAKEAKPKVIEPLWEEREV